MERYFIRYPNDEARAVLHYQCNLQLAEAFYTSLSVFEVTLRNALSREMETMTGRQDWYVVFPVTPGLTNLNRYIYSGIKTDCRSARKYHSFQGCSRIDIRFLGIVVE